MSRATVVSAIALVLAAVPSAAVPAPVRVTSVQAPVAAAPLPIRIVGRVDRQGGATDMVYRRQWPSSYFETAFAGSTAYFRVGEGQMTLQVTVDGRAAARLVRPQPGYYRIDGLSRGVHRVRIEVTSESQAGPTVFGGFFAGPGTAPRTPRGRARQIEFIGDSHTVGYGNISPTRTCSEREIWETTDSARGLAARVAARLDADYQVNAISGRGVVRNYGGFVADPLPDAYPYTLFDRTIRYSDAAWKPDTIVIALGTNDFSTPLKPGERWTTRAALHVDYEARYVGFVRQLRARNPQARFVLWATDLAGGEVIAETRKVADRLRAAGETRVTFVPVRGLTFAACNAHPSLADDQAIADALGRAIVPVR